MTAQPPPVPQGPPPGGVGVASFFDRIRRYGAVRPDDGRWFAGVAAALARRWGIDPLLVRGGFVVLAVFGGVGLLLYGLCWLFLPHPDGRIHAQEVLRGVVTAGFVGGLLCVLLDLGGTGWSRGRWSVGPHPFGGGIFFVALVVLAVWWFTGGRRRHRSRGGWGGPGGAGGWGQGWNGPGRSGGGWGGPGDWAGPGGHAGPGQAGSPGGAPEAGPGPGGTGPGGSEQGGSEQGGSEQGGSEPGAGDLPPYGTPPAPPTAFSSGTDHPPSGFASGAQPSWRPGGTAAATVVLPPPVPDRSRPDVQRPSHALTSAVLGAALLGAAAVLAWNLLWGVPGPAGVVAVAVALGIIAVGVLVAGVSGRRAGGLAPIGILLAVVALAGSAARGPVTWAGERTWTPTVLPAGVTNYDLGVGNGRLDLRQVSAPGATPADPAQVGARVGVGNLVVVVPSGTAVRVIATAGAGNVENAAALPATTGAGNAGIAAALPAPTGAVPAPGQADRRGPHADIDVQTASDPVIVVRADVGVGNLTIQRTNG